MLLGVLALAVASGILHYADADPVAVFVVSGAALAGLAWVIAVATETVGDRFGPAATGVLQSTLGNLPELFVVLFALSAGEVVVAKTSIVGSLLANALLVLGLAIVAGARAAPDGVTETPSTAMTNTASSSSVAVSFGSRRDPAVETIGISKAFTGLVIVGIAGNAVENVVGIVLAAKGQSDLAISVVKNSVAQIAVFLFPALVLLSLFFSTRLTFVLNPIYVIALVLMAVAVWQITGDGKAVMFEGFALVTLYVVVAALAFYE